jgi:hypothetical protein
MARVRICRAAGCNFENPLDEMFCGGPCGGASLANAPEVESGSGLPESAAPAPASAPTAAAPPNPTPGTTLERSAPTVLLSFPWGEEALDGRVGIGRDPAFSRFAAPLDRYPTVSGRHAELQPVEGGLRVLHVGRTNPTYVDGRPLTTGKSALVRDGSELAFSSALVVRVRLG